MSIYVCNIKIEGDNKQLSKFKSNVIDYDGFHFHNLVPTPTEYFSDPIDNKIVIKYGASNCVKWRIKNWGTKGCEYDSFYAIKSEPNLWVIELETSYYAPIVWLNTVSKMYNALTFEIIFTSEEDEYGAGYIIKNGDNKPIPGRLINVAGSEEREVYYDSESGSWKYVDNNSLCINDYIILKFQKHEY